MILLDKLNRTTVWTCKDKVVPEHAMKTYEETEIELLSFLVPTETEILIRLTARPIYHLGNRARTHWTGVWVHRITMQKDLEMDGTGTPTAYCRY